MVSIFVFVADEGPVAKGASYYQQAGRERDFEGEDPIMDAYRDNVGFNDDGQQKLLDAARDEMVTITILTTNFISRVNLLCLCLKHFRALCTPNAPINCAAKILSRVHFQQRGSWRLFLSVA